MGKPYHFDYEVTFRKIQHDEFELITYNSPYKADKRVHDDVHYSIFNQKMIDFHKLKYNRKYSLHFRMMYIPNTSPGDEGTYDTIPELIEIKLVK